MRSLKNTLALSLGILTLGTLAACTSPEEPAAPETSSTATAAPGASTGSENTASPNSSTAEIVEDFERSFLVTYQLDGEATNATVIYNVGESDAQEETAIAAGWSHDTEVKGIFGASLAATNGPGEAGPITCRILTAGQVISEETASGEGASANCTASVDQLKAAVD